MTPGGEIGETAVRLPPFIVFGMAVLAWRSDPFQQHLPGRVILPKAPDKEFQMGQAWPRHRMNAEVEGQPFGVKPRG